MRAAEGRNPLRFGTATLGIRQVFAKQSVNLNHCGNRFKFDYTGAVPQQGPDIAKLQYISMIELHLQMHNRGRALHIEDYPAAGKQSGHARDSEAHVLTESLS